VFKIKVLANKFVNLYVKLAKMEENNNNSLCKIMDIVFGFERSCLKDLCRILDIEHIVNKYNKRFLSDYIVNFKAEKKVKKKMELKVVLIMSRKHQMLMIFLLLNIILILFLIISIIVINLMKTMSVNV
jgi:hypothetical protein